MLMPTYPRPKIRRAPDIEAIGSLPYRVYPRIHFVSHGFKKVSFCYRWFSDLLKSVFYVLNLPVVLPDRDVPVTIAAPDVVVPDPLFRLPCFFLAAAGRGAAAGGVCLGPEGAVAAAGACAGAGAAAAGAAVCADEEAVSAASASVEKAAKGSSPS